MKTALLNNLKSIAEKQQFQNIFEQLNALEDTDGFLDVVVLGQFKAGKSSLINHLLGSNVLPMGVLPVTAIITRISYAPKEQIVITYMDDTTESIKTDALFRYVTEEENPDNNKNVRLVDVFVPEMEQFRRLRLIDTPGMGSVFKHNSEVTQQWFHKVGIAFVMINATQPFSEQDVELIQSALNQSPEVFLLLSKTDLLSREELKKVTDFLTVKSKELFHKEFSILPYSIKSKSDLYKKNLLSSIISLADQVDVKQQEVFSHKLNYLTRLTNSYLDIKLASAGKEENDRHRLKEDIFIEQLKFSFIKKELQYISRHYKDETRIALENNILQQQLTALSADLQQELNKEHVHWSGNLYRVARQYESWLRAYMKQSLVSIEENLRPENEKILKAAMDHLNHYADVFRKRLNARIKEVLDVDLPEERFMVELKSLEKPDIKTSWAFESHIDLLWFFIPMSFFRKFFVKSFVKNMPAEAEKNLRRLVALLTLHINESIEHAEFQLEHYIKNQLDNIELLLTSEKSDFQDISADKRLLEPFI